MINSSSSYININISIARTYRLDSLAYYSGRSDAIIVIDVSNDSKITIDDIEIKSVSGYYVSIIRNF